MPLEEPKLTNSSAKEFLDVSLGIRPLSEQEMHEVINKFSAGVVSGLKEQKLEGSGPMMLRTGLTPPEIKPEKLAGQQAIGVDVGGTYGRFGVGEITPIKVEFIQEPEVVEIETKYKSTNDFFKKLLNSGLGELLKSYPRLPMAFIFSQGGFGQKTPEGLDMVVVSLGKGWEIPGLINHGIGRMQNDFLEKNGYSKRSYVFLNDTVALITSSDYDASIVCASGYNWSWVVFLRLLAETKSQEGQTVLNTEAGRADTAPRIKAVEILKKRLGDVPYLDEYQISGNFLGQLLGITIEGLREECGLFKMATKLNLPKSFIISQILDGKWIEVNRELGIAQNVSLSLNEKSLLADIAQALKDRSAQIVACHFTALWQTLSPEKTKIVIASDGPIIQKVPGWKEKFLEEVQELTGGKVSLDIRETQYSENRDVRGILDVIYQTVAYFHLLPSQQS